MDSGTLVQIIMGLELIGLYVLWRLGLWRRLKDQLDAIFTRVANGRSGLSKRIAQSMVRVADYLELTRGTRMSPATFWLGYAVFGTFVVELLSTSGGDDWWRILFSLELLLVVIAAMFAILVGNSLYNGAAQKAMARQLPDALGIMGDEISAGHAAEAAVQRVAMQFSKPINQEFEDALIKMVSSGGLIPIDEALAEIAQNPIYQSDALDQAALTISVVRPMGGDLGKLLNDLSRLLRKRESTDREIRTLLAPGRQAAWTLVFIIGGLQLGLLVFPLSSALLLGTFVGRFVVILALILICLSVFTINQINSKAV
jgi:Flp pilus assembly protein TadB